jgi:hypothetical protein
MHQPALLLAADEYSHRKEAVPPSRQVLSRTWRYCYFPTCVVIVRKNAGTTYDYVTSPDVVQEPGARRVVVVSLQLAS